MVELSLRNAGTLLIVGSGRCVWDDLDLLAGWNHDWMAINFAGMCVAVERRNRPVIDHWNSADHRKNQNPLKYWYTGHPHMLPGWMEVRKNEYRRMVEADDFKTLGPCEPADIIVQYPFKAGAITGLPTPIKWALDGDYDHVIIAGCPMDGTGHFYNHPKTTTPYHEWLPRWKRFMTPYRDRVTALSGNLQNKDLWT